MTSDWILAHAGSLRNAARLADKNNQRLLFRPNVVDETDVSSRHAIRHLNEQRKAEGKPPIIANSYGKTNELHDPENGYHVTHSNVGPKVKKGQEISENIARDKARVRNTVMAADNTDWRHARYLLNLGYDREGQPSVPHAQPIGDDQMIVSFNALVRHTDVCF
mgnify:CR=1 FL=1